MKSDQREIRKPRRDQRPGDEIQPIRPRESASSRPLRRSRLEFLRPPLQQKRDDQHAQAAQRRNQQYRKRVLISAAPVQNKRHNQRPQRRARLIQRFIQSENPAMPDHMPCMREHRFHRRPAYRAPGALRHQQRRRQRPIPRQSQRRHRQHIHRVSYKCEKPILVRTIREISGNRSQAEPGKLAGAGHEADRSRAGPEIV